MVFLSDLGAPFFSKLRTRCAEGAKRDKLFVLSVFHATADKNHRLNVGSFLHRSARVWEESLAWFTSGPGRPGFRATLSGALAKAIGPYPF